MSRLTFRRRSTWVIILTLLGGCTSSLEPTKFTNPRFDFGFVRRVAVLPFENLTGDNNAGYRSTRLMITELLASGAVDVAESGEVQAAVARLPRAASGQTPTPSTQDVIALGEELGVEALIMGTVTQSEILRTGQVGWPVVTLDAHMVEVETGAAVWAATHTERGSSLSAKVLGTAGEPLSVTTRRCIRELMKTLLE